MEICLIAGVAENGVIGINNTLPWRIPEDLKYFKRQTLGNPIIMGRKTWQSLLKPLPERVNIVLTRQKSLDDKKGKTNSQREIIDNVHKTKIGYLSSSIEESINIAKNQVSLFDVYSKKIFVIGGANVYAQFLDKADKLYITKIHQNFAGDAFFPKWDDIEKDFMPIIEEEQISQSGIKFAFIEYQRR